MNDADKPLKVIEPAQAQLLQPLLRDLGLDENDAARVQEYVGRASSPATIKAYRSDWALFEQWCADNGYTSLPATPAVTAAFLTLLAEKGYASSAPRRSKLGAELPPLAPRPLAAPTIDRRLAAIVFAHNAKGEVPPTKQPDAVRLEKAMRGIRRAKASRQKVKKAAADGDVLRDMLRSIDGESLRDYRDRALLAIGMAGALRRSELVAIRMRDLTFEARGLKIFIPSSKADQEGRGAVIAIPDGKRLEPVRHLKAWIERGELLQIGPDVSEEILPDPEHLEHPGNRCVFRRLTPQGRLPKNPAPGTYGMKDKGVAAVVKRAALAAGQDPALFSGHSLRAGFLTEAGRQDANLFKMREHSRHASIEQVAGYVRDEEKFRGHAGDKFL